MKKTAIITGSTDGIGKHTALGLAQKGFDIILSGRNEAKGKIIQNEIQQLNPNVKVFFYPVDFSKQSSIRKFADNINQKHEHIHVLVNNVGLLKSERIETEDGVEQMFAVNHLAAFLLSHLLLDQLKKSAPARIVNVSGGAYKFGKIQLDNLNLKNGFSPFKALAQAKLANLLFTHEAHRQWNESGIQLFAADPGAAKTPGHNEHQYWWLKWMLPLIGTSPEKAAFSSIRASSAPELNDKSGIFIDVKGRQTKLSELIPEPGIAGQLWEKSLEMVGGRLK